MSFPSVARSGALASSTQIVVTGVCSGLGVAVLLTTLGFSSALASEPLKVHAPRMNDPSAPLFAGFTAATGIAVELVEVPAEALSETDGNGDALPADVLMVVDSSNIQRYVELGLLQSVDSPEIDQRVVGGFHDLDAGWVGYATRVRVVFANPEKQQTPPRSYEELADPRYRGQLCLGGGGSPYNVSLVASMVAHHGEEAAEAWVEGVVANLARPSGGRDSQLLEAVADGGECSLTVANHYYYLRLLHSDSAEQRQAVESLNLIWPNQEGDGVEGRGAYRNVAAFGLARGTTRGEAATRFLEYLVGDTVQRDVAAGLFLPVAADLENARPEWMPPETRLDTTPMGDLGVHARGAREIMARAGWN